MNKFEYEHRRDLEHTARETQRQYQTFRGQEGSEFQQAAKRTRDAAQVDLEDWDDHVVQLIPAPAGMTAVYKDEIGEHSGAIIMCALTRRGVMVGLSFDPEGVFQPADNISNFVRYEYEAEKHLMERKDRGR